MLTYHPIHDPSHCTFRFLCLLEDVNTVEAPWDLLRILDFYTLFPHLLQKMRFPEELAPHRAHLRTIKAPYENLPPKAKLMFELGIIQDQAIKSLTAKGLVEFEPYLMGKIKLRRGLLPKEIIALIHNAKFRGEDWYKFVVNFLPKVKLKGPEGLKARTGLLEYRYDVI